VAGEGGTRTAGISGPNDWFVDEMFDAWKLDPASVPEVWRDFFGGDVPSSAGPARGAHRPAPAAPSPAPTRPPKLAPPPVHTAAPSPAPPAPPAAPPLGSPLRGVALTVARNMDASLSMPTATSVRAVPAKLLERNRLIMNNYLRRHREGKVSFTHLIGYAVVSALKALPVMNNEYVPGGSDHGPLLHRREHIGLGLAVDTARPDGTRTLMVVCIKNAEALDFRGFWLAYEELIRKVRTGKITPDDFSGATVTLTNPGTIGTGHSVPRLMPGQGCIVGVGRIDYPAAFKAADERALAELGLSKEVVLTSTYDHRIIQGAESGQFLATIEHYLMGEDGFYDRAFESLGVPYVPVRWSRDVNPVDSETGRLHKQIHVQNLVFNYRLRGHLIADLDPLDLMAPKLHAELDPATYGLTLWDLDREFLTDGLAGTQRLTLGEILVLLRDAYCRTVGIEYLHIQEPAEQRWIQEQVEGRSWSTSPEEQRHVLDRLNAAEALEKFLDTKYRGAKRFGIEGAESAIVILDAVLDAAAVAGVPEAVLGMTHRGRLNVLVNIVGQPYGELFDQFEGNLDPETTQGSGDVKYHKGFHGTYAGLSDTPIDVTLASNPSHLEAVDPIVVGMVRARQDVRDEPGRSAVLPVLIHGDAAFAGQGVVAETLNMSQLRGYKVGGTVHLVINNQLGFTTAPDAARSSQYSTDVAKMVQAPIFHVNGDDPEACARVGRLALGYRQAFHKDVVIEMVCYRRFGHNETDDPSLTQPLMYERIKHRRSVRKLYVESLVRRGDITVDEAETALADFSTRLQRALEETRKAAPPKLSVLPPPPRPAPLLPPAKTAVDRDALERVASALFSHPDSFTVHPKLEKVLDQRRQLWEQGQVDWAMGESLAFGTMLLDGHDVRIAGQDTRRGTFSHRNAVLVDHRTGIDHRPLDHVDPEQGRFFIYDSLLSEYAALGFEYGYATVHRHAFVAWEAQFGDFVNGAQIVIDQFLAAAEDKWDQTCGLTLLLPHGYEGQGPEHSSGRIERFLTLCAEANMQVADVTTASQLFHLLRRQVVRDFPKPLVLFTPKAFLRAKEAHSPLDELTDGVFHEVLDDATVTDVAAVRRVVLASGKVALEALNEKATRGVDDVAVVRVEQLYPFPEGPIAEVLARYDQATSLCWLQEEPENMGAWSFVRSRLERAFAHDVALTHVSRWESGSPATGSKEVSDLEKADLLRRALT
jgi:2-oxoglutarate dehydrogenase E1 component